MLFYIYLLVLLRLLGYLIVLGLNWIFPVETIYCPVFFLRHSPGQVMIACRSYLNTDTKRPVDSRGWDEIRFFAGRDAWRAK